MRGILGYLVFCSSFAEFQTIIKTLFRLVTAVFLDESVLACKKRIISLVSTHVFAIDPCDVSSDNNEEPNENKSYKDTFTYKWIREIYDESVKKHNNTKSDKTVERIENAFYLENGIDFLLYTLCRFPLRDKHNE